MNPQRRRLPGHRWHFQHGPIDLVIGAEGDETAVLQAHEAAWSRFQTLLAELVAELPTLRRPVMGPCPLRGAVAQRMWRACHPFHHDYITPMAAVAGAGAQELVRCYQVDGVERAWVNNGGDIALHLAPGRSVRVGLFADLAQFDPFATLSPSIGHVDSTITVHAGQPVRGIATSGWRGRSFSRGIADSVTVLARTASGADAAATVIANAVDIDDPRIVRRPAASLCDDSDLGEILVTVEVPALAPEQAIDALQAGLHCARRLRQRDLIESAMLVCQGWFMSLDDSAPRRLDGAHEVREPEAHYHSLTA